MKLRIIYNATVLVDPKWDTEAMGYVTDREIKRSGFAEAFTDEQQAKIEAAIERGETEIEV